MREAFLVELGFKVHRGLVAERAVARGSLLQRWFVPIVGLRRCRSRLHRAGLDESHGLVNDLHDQLADAAIPLPGSSGEQLQPALLSGHSRSLKEGSREGREETGKISQFFLRSLRSLRGLRATLRSSPRIDKPPRMISNSRGCISSMGVCAGNRLNTSLHSAVRDPVSLVFTFVELNWNYENVFCQKFAPSLLPSPGEPAFHTA